MARKVLFVFGASGAGTTTLAAVLAQRTSWTHLDLDDVLWLPTDPPFETLRPEADRRAALVERLACAERWVLSGSPGNWTSPIEPDLALAVFLSAPVALRSERIRRRERAQFGARIDPGGDMHAAHESFVHWAEQYDQGLLPGRSRQSHEAWIARVKCPVLRLDSSVPVGELADHVISAANVLP
jgi:adenylate kinase family enzyme